jgi:hypothetical protein
VTATRIHECEILQRVASISFCSSFAMKRSSVVIVPFNPNTPKKRRRKNTAHHGQVLSFTSDTLDSPRTAPTNDENQPFRTLDSPWTPLPQFRNWESSTSTQTSSFSDTSSVFSAQTSVNGCSNDDDPFTNSYAHEPFKASLPPPSPLESPPILLELRRKAKHNTLGTSGIRAYKSPGIPPAAQSTWTGYFLPIGSSIEQQAALVHSLSFRSVYIFNELESELLTRGNLVIF